ncbi:helix-turn-helix domain-containing protein [Oceanobacillus kimchii]|nr:helix-turn-helix domain-containing protein [Oceanobacillus kimchii]
MLNARNGNEALRLIGENRRLQLMNIAVGEAFVNYERSIDTHVSNLRRKISDLGSSASIQTVYGICYRFGVEALS